MLQQIQPFVTTINVQCITINVLYSVYDFNLFFSFKFLEELRNERRMRDSSVVSRNTGADSDVITVETEEVDEIHFGQIPQTPSHSWPKAIGIVQICSGFLTTILGTCFDFFPSFQGRWARKRKDGCSYPSRNRPQTLKQVMTAPMPKNWQ